MNFEIRTVVPPSALVPEIRRAAVSIAPGAQFSTFRTLSEQLDDSLGQEHLLASLASVFGGVALFFAALGVYGLTAYLMTQKTHEIGIRMTVGAQPADILGMAMRQSLLPVWIGGAVGLPSALVASRLISTMLFGLSPADVSTMSGSTLLLALVAALAAYLPAGRAMQVDPVVALRYE